MKNVRTLIFILVCFFLFTISVNAKIVVPGDGSWYEITADEIIKECGDDARLSVSHCQTSNPDIQTEIIHKWFPFNPDTCQVRTKKAGDSSITATFDLTLYDKHYSLNVVPRSCTISVKFGVDETPAPEPVEPDLNGEDIFKICDKDTNPQLVASLRLVGIFVSIIKIIVPIILIIMGSIDMTKAVVSKDHDAIQKNLIVFGKRTLAGVLIFLTPTVMLALFHLIDGMDNFDSAYKTCVDCILGDSSCPDVKFIQ